MDTIKRSLVVLAAAFAMASTSALAQDVLAKNSKNWVSQAVQMNDAQLDEITAASAAMTFMFLNIPADMSLTKVNNNHVTSINAAGTPSEQGATGMLFIFKEGREPVIKCVGRGC